MSILDTILQKNVETLKMQSASGWSMVNALKEVVHLPVLDFVYNHSTYNDLIMHGGTLLRQVYDLSRMSEDLDFETSKNIDAESFRHDLEDYLAQQIDGVTVSAHQNTAQDVWSFTITFAGLLSKLQVPVPKPDLKIRVDIHYLAYSDQLPTVIHPLVKGRYVIGIRGYTMSILMATKTVALLKRDVRNIRGKESDCKPRDVFDMIWYLERGLLPDMRYIRARGLLVNNLWELMQLVQRRMLSLHDNVFEDDLAQFFPEEGDYTLWYTSWRTRAEYLLASYMLVKVLEPLRLVYGIDYERDVHNFHFFFATEEGREVKFSFRVSEEFLRWAKMEEVPVDAFKQLFDNKIEGSMNAAALQFAVLFFEKLTSFLKRTESKVSMPKGVVRSKIILYAKQPNAPQEQVHMDEETFLRANLEDLL